MKKLKLTEIIREEILRENIENLHEGGFSKFIDAIKREVKRWKDAWDNEVNTSGGSLVPRQLPITFAIFFGVMSLSPLIAAWLLGEGLYTVTEKKFREIKRNRRLSKPEELKELMELADETLGKLPTGKKRYMKSLVNKVQGSSSKDTDAAKDLEDYISRVK
jgi:hypothetical protein